MAGILTKGIKLYYKVGTTATDYTEITGLQECPALGGAADKVDVTTLADGNYKYINGIKDFGDLAFKFLYDNAGTTSNYRICRDLEEDEAIVNWRVEFPDAVTDSTGHGTQFQFTGQCSTQTEAGAVNNAITFTLNITLNSDITVVNPT